MSANGSPERPVIADTVVVNYFLAVGLIRLLEKVLGSPVQVPRAVFDPDEGDGIAKEAASELRRGLWLHRDRSKEKRLPVEVQQRSVRALPHFESLPVLVTEGVLVVIDLQDEERETFARLRDRRFVAQFSLVAGLGRGEAASLAIAVNRNYDIATDDQDAIKILKSLRPDLKAIRIRALLRRGVDSRLLTTKQARGIHMEMLRAGFWDKATI